MDRGVGLDEDIGGAIGGASQQEGYCFLTRETDGLDGMSGGEIQNGVMLMRSAFAGLADRGVVTAGVHRGTQWWQRIGGIERLYMWRSGYWRSITDQTSWTFGGGGGMSSEEGGGTGGKKEFAAGASADHARDMEFEVVVNHLFQLEVVVKIVYTRDYG